MGKGPVDRNYASVGTGRVVQAGSWRPNGATGVVASSEKGWKYSVARTSAGLYTITFEDTAIAMDSAVVGLRVATATPTIVQCGDYSNTNKTLQVRVFQAATAAVTAGKGFIPLDITSLREIISNEIGNTAADAGVLSSDTTPLLKRVNTTTDKALRLVWAATNVDELQFPTVPWPVDLDPDEDVTVHFMAKMSSTNDTPTLTVAAFEGQGDTDFGGATDALSDSLAEVSVTLANADITGHPGFLNLSFAPGAHGTDTVQMFAAWIEYTRAGWSTTGQVFSLTDLAADADNEVDFVCNFRDSGAQTK